MIRAPLALALAGCASLENTDDNGACLTDGGAGFSVERIAVRQPSCNGAKWAAACRSRYGVDLGCEHPYLLVGERCRLRSAGLDGCTKIGAVVCCP